MAETSDRRRVARLTVPRQLRGPELELHLVHILDLSVLGARIEHLEPMREGGECYLDLPPSLGRVRLTGRVVWTGLRGSEQTLEGDRRHHYQTGIEFTGLTVEQQTALACALETLKAASNAKDRPPPR
jgi:PilZ domain